MNNFRFAVAVFLVSLFALSCASRNENNTGASTPIDSTNVNGTAPATYGGNNPANDEKDSNRANVNDTGTKANNVHNAGTYSNTSADSQNAIKEKNKAAAEKSADQR
jgi:hypothetical protein